MYSKFEITMKLLVKDVGNVRANTNVLSDTVGEAISNINPKVIEVKDICTSFTGKLAKK